VNIQGCLKVAYFNHKKEPIRYSRIMFLVNFLFLEIVPI